MQDWIAPVAVGVLALAALGLGLALWRVRASMDRELVASRVETAALRLQVEELERRLSRPGPRPPTDPEFVITDLGDPGPAPEPVPAPRVGGALFADLALRETAVKAAGLVFGVRRALDAETRNRIRFEMRREVRRARRQRKADSRQARREWAARQRAALDADGSPKGSVA